MDKSPEPFQCSALNYLERLDYFTQEIIGKIELLSLELQQTWGERRQVFICGNGGSAANALHMANDFITALAPVTQGQEFQD